MAEVHKIEIAGNVTTINTPDGFGALLVAAMAEQKKYPATVANPDYVEGGEEPETIANPTTKETFCAEQIVVFCRQIVAGYRMKTAQADAAATTAAQNETDRKLVTIG